MEKADSTARIRRNLSDAGCSASTSSRFMQLHNEGKNLEQLRLLKTHRMALLKKIHDNQKRIDCLDFLIFSMEQRIE